MATIYERMDAAELNIQGLQAEHADSGWLDLPLVEGITAYNSAVLPKYRKVGNKVYVKGELKNVLASGTLATLPEGFRPAEGSHYYMQNTSYNGGVIQFARLKITTAGEVVIEGTTGAYGADKWFPIHTEFLVD